jgi:hypothetical protein
MELHNLKPAKGALKDKKRAVGRGEGTKKGGTATNLSFKSMSAEIFTLLFSANLNIFIS